MRPPSSDTALPILVLGVGNTLMRDDGVGVRLMEALAAVEPTLRGVEYVDAGTLSFLLLPMIEQCRALLVLDAAHLDTAPGEIRCLEGAGWTISCAPRVAACTRWACVTCSTWRA